MTNYHRVIWSRIGSNSFQLRPLPSSDDDKQTFNLISMKPKPYEQIKPWKLCWQLHDRSKHLVGLQFIGGFHNRWKFHSTERKFREVSLKTCFNLFYIWTRSKWCDGFRIDVSMTLCILNFIRGWLRKQEHSRTYILLDVLEVGTVSECWMIPIQVLEPSIDIRIIVPNCAQVTFEMIFVYSIEAHNSRVGPNI